MWNSWAILINERLKYFTQILFCLLRRKMPHAEVRDAVGCMYSTYISYGSMASFFMATAVV